MSQSEDVEAVKRAADGQHQNRPGPLEEALRAAEGWTGENPQLYADPPPIGRVESFGNVPIVADHPNADTPTNVFAATVAREAVDLFTGPRVNDYGDATDNFQDIADLWSVVLRPLLKPGARITAEQAALCQAQIKIARLNNTPDHDDSWVDATAYLALGGGINRRRRA